MNNSKYKHKIPHYLLVVLLAAFLQACGGGGSSGENNPGMSAANFSFDEDPVVAVLPEISEEAFHVEYPTVYKVDGGFGMLYSAIGNDYRWRIKSAYSIDGKIWQRWGGIFNESTIPFGHRYAFPYVIKNTQNGYEAYFAVEPNSNGTYQQLWKSYSTDGLQWGSPVFQFSDNMVIDPVVLGGGATILYTSRNSNNHDVVKIRRLKNGFWIDSQIVYTPTSGI